MHTAAQALVGRHDFTTFRDSSCQAKSPIKTLDRARVWRDGEEVRLAFASRSFLHRQVRSMTGTLAEVGAGRWTAADVEAALEARDRRACGPGGAVRRAVFFGSRLLNGRRDVSPMAADGLCAKPCRSMSYKPLARLAFSLAFTVVLGFAVLARQAEAAPAQGMVAAANPLAADAGLKVLQRGR